MAKSQTASAKAKGISEAGPLKAKGQGSGNVNKRKRLDSKATILSSHMASEIPDMPLSSLYKTESKKQDEGISNDN